VFFNLPFTIHYLLSAGLPVFFDQQTRQLRSTREIAPQNSISQIFDVKNA
jgi:hypothetical protein